METKTVNLKEFADRECPNFHKLIPEEQKVVVVDAILQAIPEVVKISPVDTGLYAQSWRHSVESDRILFGNVAPHAPIIEYGARPFTPPLAPLLAWAKRVLQDPSQPPDYSPRVQSLARAVQMKIKAKGMEPRHIMEQGVKIILDNIERALRDV